VSAPKKRQRYSDGEGGFNLTELLVAILIIFLLSGLATYAFVGLSESFRIKAAVQSIDSIMRRARQTAVSTRSDRRVVIEMYRNPASDPTLSAENIPVRMWIERQRIQFLSWGHLPFDQDPDRVELVSDISQLPEFMRVSDVTGLDAPTLLAEAAPGSDRVLLYFEYSSTGSVRVYFNSIDGRKRTLEDVIPMLLPDASTNAIFVHVVRKDERLEALGKVAGSEQIFYYFASGGRVFYMDDRTRVVDLGVITDVGGGAVLSDLSGNGFAVTEYDAVRLQVERQMRNQVGTIHVIPQTGRTRAYDYGIGYPWSKLEIQEGAS
jgi:type II secretory pathway pseudopilin PulG